jgi:hypothetical protein
MQVIPPISLLSVHRIKKTDASKLQEEYAKLVEGLQETTDEQPDEDSFMTSPGMLYTVPVSTADGPES